MPIFSCAVGLRFISGPITRTRSSRPTAVSKPTADFWAVRLRKRLAATVSTLRTKAGASIVERCTDCPADPDKQVELALYPESDPSHVAGHASTNQVGPQKSELELLDIDADPSARYQAEITSLPVPPLAVYLEGDAKGMAALQEFLAASEDGSLGFALLTETPEGARYRLCAEDDCYLLKLSETGKLIQGAKGYTRASADYMFSILKRVAAWERALALQNHATKMNPDDVHFKFCEVLGDDDQQHEFPSTDITVDIDKQNGEWKVVRGTLKADNRTQQTLHLLLVHFSEDYRHPNAVQRVAWNPRIPSSSSRLTATQSSIWLWKKAKATRPSIRSS